MQIRLGATDIILKAKCPHDVMCLVILCAAVVNYNLELFRFETQVHCSI